jgi:integrase
MAGRRRFGRIRKLPSGRYQARYLGPDGIDRPAPGTFATKHAAEVWLVKTEAEIRSDYWIDPDDGRALFGKFALAWVEERPGLRPNTVQVYRYVLLRHLIPTFGNSAIADIREAHVRRWRKNLLDAGVSPTSIAKSYRLLKAIMTTAVEDGIIRRSPCRIRGAALDRSAERSVLTLRQVVTLAGAIHPRYRALILLAVFGSMRWGELAALRRCDIDVRNGSVRIERSLTQLPGGGYLFGPPKSEAGRRMVVIPAAIRPELARHLEAFTGPADDALVFTSPTGAQLHHGNFRRRIWVPALARAGMTGTHFHDLRHTGNALTATTGATLRELMDRMGHSSPRAALIYLHGSDARQQAIAEGLSELAGPELRKGRRRPSGRGAPGRSGTQRARKAVDGS